MMGKRKQAWSIGDVLMIPQKDGGYAPAQILDHVMKNVVGIALYERRVSKETKYPNLSALHPVSVLLTTRDLLDEGMWEVVGKQRIAVPADKRPYERFRESDWVGSKTYGSGIVRVFLDACFGLAPWDDWKDPNYLDALLLDPTTRPAAVVYKK